ncbi:hypothetical protein CUMW_203770 [Citrus unshiu]|uniref:DUF1985 domain-containing protein n=1 Tax=Citrus unshiu TaxID=55188 RepID=A0A2H5Q7V3_CITUN|nr:hypothetical protein CUMW_203770 [Citrus unshiu]
MVKSESSDIEVGRMYFRYADHFPGRISSMCNLSSVIKAIEEKLTKRQLNLFKKDVFEYFLECRSFPFSGVILHNLLLRQVAHEEDSREDQLWFQIGEHLTCLSIVEWCLVTGLSYGVDTELRNNKTVHRLRNTYFGGVHRKIKLKEFDALFKKLKFEEMDDMDALKIALFYFANIVLNARKNHCQINFDWLNGVDNIEYFRNRPWGLLSWEMIYESLDDALFEKDEKFKMTRLKNPDHNIEKYNVYGFTSGVQVVLNQLWNNGNCAVDSLVLDDRLNCYLCGRQHTMSKSMTDVDMPLEVIFRRWLEYVCFYNIRLELRSADPWKVIVVKSAPQQEPGTGDCGVFVLVFTMYLMFGLRLEFNASHVEYFRKKITVDIFYDDIVL